MRPRERSCPADRCAPTGLLARTEYSGQSEKEDLEIKPQGPILDVIVVELDSVED